jgi:hypothetical protein
MFEQHRAHDQMWRQLHQHIASPATSTRREISCKSVTNSSCNPSPSVQRSCKSAKAHTMPAPYQATGCLPGQAATCDTGQTTMAAGACSGKVQEGDRHSAARPFFPVVPAAAAAACEAGSLRNALNGATPEVCAPGRRAAAVVLATSPATAGSTAVLRCHDSASSLTSGLASRRVCPLALQ